MLIERDAELAIVRLQGGKANAMTRELLEGLITLFDQVAASEARAVVLTGYERFFSAGLALPTLVGLSREAMRDFIDLFAAAMLRVYRLDRPVIAAINGHAIAGGCVLAMMADVRLLADGPGRIGLNEVQLGIGLPAVVLEPLRCQVPASSLPILALEGRICAPAEALRLGLVDELVAPERLEARALERARALATAPPSGVAQVKSALRRPAVEAVALRGDREREAWLDTWFSPAAQARLQETVARLR